MSALDEYYIGIDLGTSYTKALVVNGDGDQISVASSPTLWSGSRSGAVEGIAGEFVDGVLVAIADAIELAETQLGHAISIAGIGIAGLAESGVVIDSDGFVTTPVIAWYDERGEVEMAALPQSFKDNFSRKTGLLFTAQCSLGKWMQLHNNEKKFVKGQMWLNLLEYIAFELTGNSFTAPSLSNRTGAWDIDADTPWQEALDLFGLDASFFPPVRHPGESYGIVNRSNVPSQIIGAHVTVAGHDHPVASVGAGAVGGDVLFNSCGTADVLIRAVTGTISPDSREKLVEGGIGSGAHVLPSMTVMIAGSRAGLILRRVTSLYSNLLPDVKENFDKGWDINADHSAVIVSEPNFMSNEVNFTLVNEASSQTMWNAVIAYNTNETRKLLQHMNSVVGKHKVSRVSGGWVRLRSVIESKRTLMPELTVSDRQQPGAFGAAAFAYIAAKGKFESIHESISEFVSEKVK
jgi:sugar (pentulose or hexulose) kinase